MISTASVPRHRTIVEHLREMSGWLSAIEQFRPRFEPDLQIPGLDTLSAQDVQTIVAEACLLMKLAGALSWRSKRDLSTYGISLSFNPDHDPADWHRGSFGHERYQTVSSYAYYKTVEKDIPNRVKGDYLDSYGFRSLLPLIHQQCPTLSLLLGNFKVPIVRASLRILNGLLCTPNLASDSGMHRDESPFEVLRVNLCLTSNGCFGYQYRGHAPVWIEPGSHWVVNADHDHRVVVPRITNFQRMHLVIGLVPWFDYDPVKDAWSTNPWFGNQHPYDLAKQGLLFDRTAL